MDDRTGKHSAKGLRTYDQQTTANIHVRDLKNFFFLVSFFFLPPPKNEKD
jgi:hypothetical protein